MAQWVVCFSLCPCPSLVRALSQNKILKEKKGVGTMEGWASFYGVAEYLVVSLRSILRVQRTFLEHSFWNQTVYAFEVFLGCREFSLTEMVGWYLTDFPQCCKERKVPTFLLVYLLNYLPSYSYDLWQIFISNREVEQNCNYGSCNKPCQI